MKRKFQQDGFTVIVERVSDTDRRAETPEEQQANYDGCTAEEKAEYFKQDAARYQAWLNDEWSYMGVTVSIRKQTASNWADGGLEVGRASVWGIESDSEEQDFQELENEGIEEAFAEVQRLRDALCAVATA